MTVEKTRIDGLWVVIRTLIEDGRGSFYRAFCDEELGELLGGRQIRQINVSRTRRVGAVRGLHFQSPPHAEMKLIRCLRGRVWDIAVDLRRASPTFLQWHAEELSPDNGNMLVISEGFAHGFQVLEPDSELLYLHTAPYVPSSEGGLRYNEPEVGIAWPLEITDISDRDMKHSPIDKETLGVLP